MEWQCYGTTDPGLDTPAGDPDVPVSSGGAEAPKTALGYESVATLAAIRNETYFGTRSGFSVTGAASAWFAGQGRGALKGLKGLGSAVVHGVGCFGDLECQFKNGVGAITGIPKQTAAQLESLKECLAGPGNDCAAEMGEHAGELAVQYGFGEFIGMVGRRITKAGAVEAPTQAREPGCFVAGTLVATAHGPRPIEDIEVGDLVWAEDERTGDVSLRRVARTFVVDDKDIVEVVISGAGDGDVERIEATPGHPFWTLRGWVGAGELAPGDQVLTRAQAWREVVAVRVVDGKRTVYNFEVEDDHTYFVGTGGYLVHNTPPTCGGGGGGPAKALTPIYRQFTKGNFRHNLRKLSGLEPRGAQAHHVFPQKFEASFRRVGIDIHDPHFGAWWDASGHQAMASGYNQAFDAFMRSNPAATRVQILGFGRSLAQRYGLDVYF